MADWFFSAGSRKDLISPHFEASRSTCSLLWTTAVIEFPWEMGPPLYLREPPNRYRSCCWSSAVSHCWYCSSVQPQPSVANR